MAAGVIVSRSNFDASIGQRARNLKLELQFWADLNTWIANVAGGFSGIQSSTGVFGSQFYTDVPSGSGDASRVFNSAADGKKLNDIATSAATLVSAQNFFANMQFLTGTP